MKTPEALKKIGVYLPRRCATAYEFQVGRLWVRWIYLSGEYWRWKPWRRLEVYWVRDDD